MSVCMQEGGAGDEGGPRGLGRGQGTQPTKIAWAKGSRGENSGAGSFLGREEQGGGPWGRKPERA